MVKNHPDSERGNLWCHMGYSFRLAARVLLYAHFHRQDSTYHSICYISRGTLDGMRNSWILGKKVTEVPFQLKYSHKENEHVLIGESAREYILKEDANQESRIVEFLQDSWTFTRLLTFFCSMRVHQKQTASQWWLTEVCRSCWCWTSDGTHSYRFALLLGTDFLCCLKKPKTKTQVLMEFVDYQSQNVSSLTKERADETWVDISKLNGTEGQLMFYNLVMLGISTIPHCHAPYKQVFSCVRKNNTDQRASMCRHTLEALMVIKSKPGESHSREYSTDTHLKLWWWSNPNLENPTAGNTRQRHLKLWWWSNPNLRNPTAGNTQQTHTRSFDGDWIQTWRILQQGILDRQVEKIEISIVQISERHVTVLKKRNVDFL